MILQPSLIRVGIRHARQHLMQTLMLIAGIALGVSVVVAIDIANSSVKKSFELSTESITGKSTHQLQGTFGKLDQSLYRQLRVDLGFRKSAPIVRGSASVVEMEGRKTQILGIDPFAEVGFRDFGLSNQLQSSPFIPLLVQPNTVWLSSGLASQFGLKVDDPMTLRFGKKEVRVTLAGLLGGANNEDEGAGGLLLSDISTAQELLEMKNHLSHIDLILDPSRPAQEEKIRQLLPPDVELVSVEDRNSSVQGLSASFEMNLTAFSLLALLVGMFLIYNTVSFSIIVRRPLMGTLRALGVTRQEIFLMVLGESLLLGIVGSIIGLLLGIVMGWGAVQLVTPSVSGLFYSLSIQTFHVSAVSLFKGFSLGMLVSLISSFFPALEANRIQPVEALSRSHLETQKIQGLPKLTSIGLALLLGGVGILAIPSKLTEVGFLGTTILVFGAAFCVPVFTLFLFRIFSPLVGSLLGVQGKMAVRNIPRSLTRTSVSIAALMIAICVYIGVGVMVESFEQTLTHWIDNSLMSDVQFSSSNYANATISPETIAFLEDHPSVLSTEKNKIEIVQNGPYMNSFLYVTDQLNLNKQWHWTELPIDQLPDQFAQGSVFISETFAAQHEFYSIAGQTLQLNSPQGPQTFRVAGIFNDFFLRGGRIIISQAHYQKYWNDPTYSNIGVSLKSGVTAQNFIESVTHELPQKQIDSQPTITIKNRILRAFEQTFSITIALRLLAAVVAFFGIWNAVMALMLERIHEIGVLRANGMTQGQLWRMVLIESGIIGFFSGLLAIPLGLALSWILVAVINKRSFGWTLEFHPQVDILFQALLLSIAAAFLAGIFPALKTARMPIHEALRAE